MSVSFHAGSPGAILSGYRITIAILLRRIGRLIDKWVADTIARREREVAGSMRHGLGECNGASVRKLSRSGQDEPTR